jgi:hypothetical protein
MTWEYRVVMRNGEYAIYEVYYDEAGAIEAVTEAPVYPAGTSVEELGRDVKSYQQALKKPVLSYDELCKHVADAHPTSKVPCAAQGKDAMPWEQIKAELDL